MLILFCVVLNFLYDQKHISLQGGDHLLLLVDLVLLLTNIVHLEPDAVNITIIISGTRAWLALTASSSGS
jgi:hypothetical protein